MSKQYQTLLVEDVVGSFHSHHATGLLDTSTSEEFDEMLQSIW